MLRHKSETQHLIPLISNPPSTYFHLYTHGLTYTNPHSETLLHRKGGGGTPNANAVRKLGKEGCVKMQARWR